MTILREKKFLNIFFLIHCEIWSIISSYQNYMLTGVYEFDAIKQLTFYIMYSSILKAKSNFTLWTIEYNFTAFELNQIKYCNELLVSALS